MVLRRARLLLGLVLVLPLLSTLHAAPVIAATGDITTYAGSFGVGPARGVAQRVRAMVARGNVVYMADETAHVVRAFDTATGSQTIVAGNGNADRPGQSLGDGGPATAASVGYVHALAMDGAGNLFLGDSFHFRIWKVEPSGRITIVAGNGTEGDAGDGGPALSASLKTIFGMAFDADGNLFLSTGFRIRRIDPSGTITTVAGKGTYDVSAGFSPDGIPATDAQINSHTVVADAAGNIYFGDGGPRVRKVDRVGVISTLANACATTLILAPEGGLYGAGCNQVKRISLAGAMTPVAGGAYAYGGTGDGGPALQATLKAPGPLAVDGAGNLYVADVNDYRVRRVDRAGVIDTVAGNGTFSFSGDGGPATSAQLYAASGVAIDPSGNVYIGDWANHRVRRVDPSGTITTVAGNGQDAFSGDGGPATAAAIRYPSKVALDGAGNLYIASHLDFRIRKVDANGVISTVAGNGTLGYSGDGGPGPSASIGWIGGLAVDGAGVVFVSDVGGHRIRKVGVDGIISTVAGTGDQGFSGDGGSASTATFHNPNGLAVDADGNLFIADTYNGRVRRVTPAGTISTFAHTGFPLVVSSDRAGGLFVGDYVRVLRVTPNGTVTVAGTGMRGFSGDGGPATEAQFGGMGDLAFDGSDLYVADSSNARIRRVSMAVAVLPTTTSTTTTTTTTTTVPVPVGTKAAAWGLNHVGQIGTGSTGLGVTAPTPVRLAGTTAVAAGYWHSLAVMPDGTVRAWGYNVAGQVGDGTTVDRPQAVTVPGLTGVVAVAGGAFHSLALTADGTVWAWGQNTLGQLGTGDTADHLVPVRVPGLTGVTAIAAGSVHNLAVKADGSVWSWGWNGLGGLGDDTGQARVLPGPVAGLTGVVGVSAGGYHSLAVKGDGSVWAWGWNVFGQLGTGSTVDHRGTPAPVAGLTSIRSVSAGIGHSLAVGADGRVWAWGWNGVGQLGTGSDPATMVRAPMVVPGLAGVRSISAGGYHSLAALTDGTVRAWGWNGWGQLGIGTTASRDRPTAAGVAVVVEVAAGAVHSLSR